MGETSEPIVVPEIYEDIDQTWPSWWCPVYNLLIGYPDDEHGHVEVEVHERKLVRMQPLVAEGPSGG